MTQPKLSQRYDVLKPGQTPKDILIHGVRFIITFDSKDKLKILADQSILIKNGLITKIFPKENLHVELNVDELDLIYDAEQKGGIVITPGFINMHAHPPMYLLRSTLSLDEEDLVKALKGMAALEGKMNDEDFYLGALGDFTEEQKSGITTTLSHYGVFDPIEKAAKEAKQHVINCLSAASNSHPQNNVKLVEEYLQKTNTFTTPGIALHYVWKAKPEALTQISKLIKKYKAFFTLHVAETPTSVKQCIQVYGMRPIAVLKKFRLLGPNTIMSHCVQVNAEEIKLIKKTGTVVAHLPTSNLLHRSGHFPYKLFKQLKAENLITLGTDSVISKNQLDLLSEALAAKTLHQAQEVVSYEDLFKMTTSQPAKLLGFKNLGKVLPGFIANLAFWKLKDRGLTPFDEHNPATLISNMITHGSRNVRDLMINGEFIISDRYHNFVNESKLLEDLQDAHMALREAE